MTVLYMHSSSNGARFSLKCPRHFGVLQVILSIRRLGAKGSYLTLVRVADRII